MFPSSNLVPAGAGSVQTAMRSPTAATFSRSGSSAVIAAEISSAAAAAEVISFPPEVERAIEEVLPSDNPLDRPDFSTVDYINQLFPTEQSLNNLDDVITDNRYKMQCMDDEIRRIVRTQTNVGSDAAAALEEAQSAIMQLFSQIRDIKQKASESEAMVRDITRDIKQLDTAKKNLTASITTLQQLHMLVGGVTKLQTQTKQRQYKEAANLLQGLMQVQNEPLAEVNMYDKVLEHFRNYTAIPQIKELYDQVHETRRVLSEQITADFHQVLGGDNAKNFAPTKQLAEACLVVDVLEPRVKKSLLKWLVGRELAEYVIIFADNEEGTWLDKIDSRYNWLKRHLIEFEERLGPLFPVEWEMSEQVAVEFCDITRKQLERMTFRRKLEIDTKLLLHAIQRTSNFESLLSRRFSGVTLTQHQDKLRDEEEKIESTNPFEQEEELPAIDDPNNPFFEGGQDKHGKGGGPVKKQAKSDEDPTAVPGLTPFSGLIGRCFEPYLTIYIDSQDKNLADLVERAAQDQRGRGFVNMALEGSAVLHSCGDLFMFYKKCMVQCVQLSTGEPLLAMTNVFKKYLRDYASKVLITNLPKATSAAVSLSSSMTSITKELKDFSTSGFIQNFQSLMKEGESVRLNEDEKVLICTFLVTSEYCLETTQQLEGKLKEKIHPNLVGQVNMSSEQDVYHSVINSCIQLLVQELEITCEPALAAMVKMPWPTIDGVGDQSPYVTTLVNHMKVSIPLVRDNLANSKKYFTQFCVKFVNSFIPKFIQHIYRCKSISPVGAEQLLLDTHSLKTLLLDLPSIGSSKSSTSAVVARKAPASYTKIVVKGMTRAEMTLKVVMSHSDPLKQFVEQYIKLVPDVDSSEFQKVLDMKGIRKVDQGPYMDYFKTSAPHNVNALLSPSTSSGATAPIKKLENLIKKRL